MFEDAIPHEFDSPEVTSTRTRRSARWCANVELAAAAGVIAAPDPVEAAQQIWSSPCTARSPWSSRVSCSPPTRAATYRDTLETLLRGLAPQA